MATKLYVEILDNANSLKELKTSITAFLFCLPLAFSSLSKLHDKL